MKVHPVSALRTIALHAQGLDKAGGSNQQGICCSGRSIKLAVSKLTRCIKFAAANTLFYGVGSEIMLQTILTRWRLLMTGTGY